MIVTKSRSLTRIHVVRFNQIKWFLSQCAAQVNLLQCIKSLVNLNQMIKKVMANELNNQCLQEGNFYDL